MNDTKAPAWVCEQCDREFATEQACRQHQDASGHGDVPVCMTCSKSFGSKKAILQHQQSCGHVGIQWLVESDGASESRSDEVLEDVWECELCFRVFATEHACLQHQAAHPIINVDKHGFISF